MLVNNDSVTANAILRVSVLRYINIDMDINTKGVRIKSETADIGSLAGFFICLGHMIPFVLLFSSFLNRNVEPVLLPPL